MGCQAWLARPCWCTVMLGAGAGAHFTSGRLSSSGVCLMKRAAARAALVGAAQIATGRADGFNWFYSQSQLRGLPSAQRAAHMAAWTHALSTTTPPTLPTPAEFYRRPKGHRYLAAPGT